MSKETPGGWIPGAVAWVEVPDTEYGIDLLAASSARVSRMVVIKNPSDSGGPIHVTFNGDAPVFGVGYPIAAGEVERFPGAFRIRAICETGTVAVCVVSGPVIG